MAVGGTIETIVVFLVWSSEDNDAAAVVTYCSTVFELDTREVDVGDIWYESLSDAAWGGRLFDTEGLVEASAQHSLLLSRDSSEDDAVGRETVYGMLDGTVESLLACESTSVAIIPERT